MLRTWLANSIACGAALLLAAACASNPAPESTVIRTVSDFGHAGPFGRVLVVSVAGDRAARGRFERDMSAALSGEGFQAFPWIAMAGPSTPLNRRTLTSVVQAREFDAILLVREQGQEQYDLVQNRPVGQAFDILHYDYDELNTPGPIDTTSTVSFVAELYDVSSSRKIWAIESLIFENGAGLSPIDAQVSVIAAELTERPLQR